jgi:uncharacterized membrane protein YczE
MVQCVEAGAGCIAERVAPSAVTRGGATSVSRPATSLAVRSLRLAAGLWLFASGLALMVRADLGLSAWDIFHDALRTLTPLTFGQVVIAVSIAVLAGSVALGVRPGPGTIANAVLVGVFTDAILQSAFLHDLAQAEILPQLVATLVGICTIALGTALYISAELGAGPRDALMLGVARRSRRSPGAARSAIEGCVLIAGVILGGTVGIGTLAFVLFIGPAINVSFRLFGMESPSRRNARRARKAAASIKR